MSREQWGNGYRKGMADALTEMKEKRALQNFSREELETIIEYCIAKMYLYRETDGYDGDDRSAFRVGRFYSVFNSCEHIPVEVLDVVYDYIWEYRPFNTQITGPSGDKNIEEDVIRVYNSHGGHKTHMDWVNEMNERMKPIFEKIDNQWFEEHGITSWR